MRRTEPKYSFRGRFDAMNWKDNPDEGVHKLQVLLPAGSRRHRIHRVWTGNVNGDIQLTVHVMYKLYGRALLCATHSSLVIQGLGCLGVYYFMNINVCIFSWVGGDNKVEILYEKAAQRWISVQIFIANNEAERTNERQGPLIWWIDAVTWTMIICNGAGDTFTRVGGWKSADLW